MFVDHEVQAVQAGRAVASVAHGDLRQRHHGGGLLGGRHGLHTGHDDLAAHHQFRQFGGAGAGGVALGHQFALAQHRHAARHGHHFVQLVRNEDHGQAFVDEAAQGGEQILHFLRREHRGGFVQDQDAGAAVQRLQDFDALFFTDGKRAHARVRVHAQAKALAQFDQAAARLSAARGQLPERFRADHDVVQHGQVVGQREVLVHHADARCQRGVGPAGGQGLAEDLDTAGVGHIVAEQDRHQGRFAGAVLAQQGQHFALPQRKRNIVVGRQAAEAFGDPRQLQGERRLVHRAEDLGSLSLTFTVKLPSRMAFCLAWTLAIRSAGIFCSKVPSGASDEPLCFISEYWP
ncbi:hypothetical protein D3C87_157380 [compost metagenome]